ncbi:MAG: adenylate/guanylate cyclase domain-containing protein [Planctomycetota bacterium]
MSNPATIMIVDDSATNRMILEEMVMELGHQSVTAVNGKDGLDKIRKKMPDVLLLDIMMPIMNGYQVLEALKADPATRELPVLVISAVDEMESVLQCIKNGAEDYLPKPLNMLLLKARIGAILARIRAREQEEILRKESEARIRLIVETALEAVIVTDDSGNIVIWNPQAVVAFGYRQEDVIGKQLPSIVFNAAVRDSFERGWREFKTGKPWSLLNQTSESVAVRKDGSEFPIELSISLASWNQLTTLNVFIRDITERKKAEAALRLEQEKSERLLLNVLPACIATRLKNGEKSIADSFPIATVLFSDLVGFTKISSKISAAELVDLLGAVFTEFDRLTAKYGLEKIKTIGDAFMVAGGLPVPRSDHAEAVVAMGLEMLTGLERVTSHIAEPFKARIGVHSGPVVAGVIGTHKFIYDLWGDAVNTASRMESHGLPGRVQISAATYALVKDKFQTEARGLIEVKGKGAMETYLVL